MNYYLYVFFPSGPEIEEFLSILIIKQYFNMNVFVLAPRLDGSLSWINKYDNKTTSRWQQVPVLINDLLNHSNQNSFKTADSIETKQVRPSLHPNVHTIHPICPN